MPQRRHETIQFFTEDEIKRLMGAIKDKRDKAIFLIAYRHALRASEVGMLHTDHVDWKKLQLYCRRLKGSYSGWQHMEPDEIRYLKAYLRARKQQDSPILFPSAFGTPISRKRLDRLMKDYCKVAKLPSDKAHFHVLKHSIATHLLNIGYELRFVQDWLGHANIQNTVDYTHLVSAARIAQARKNFMKLPHF